MERMSISNGLPGLSLTIATETPETPETPVMQQEFVNKTLDSYEILQKLGQGAFGTVFKVRDKQNGKFFALKVLQIKDENVLRQTQKEIANLIKISTPKCHPHLSCYYGSYYDPDKRQMLIEMEFIDGPELGKWVENYKKTSTWTTAKLYAYLSAIMIKILDALKYVHANNLIHRDIKPQNILMQKTGQKVEFFGEMVDNYVPKLVDFGIACETEICQTIIPRVSVTCCKGRAGTPIFMAPETILSNESFFVSDVWSLGVTIFALAYNQYPFNFPNLQSDDPKRIYQVISGIIAASLPLKMATTNDKLNYAVNSMLEKDPLKRVTVDQLLKFYNV